MNVSLDESILDLKRSWAKSPYPSVKISSYFPAYAELFRHLRGTKCIFVETGVLDGGSLFMWRDWLGEQARIIGIELNPEAARWREHGFEIFIGDQGDPEFWRNTLGAIGQFDALLDDGGHQSFQQIVTASEAIKFAKSRCVIVVEDTNTSFMADFSARHGAYSFLEYSKGCTDVLIGRSVEMYKQRFPRTVNRKMIDQFEKVFSIRFYDGIVSFHVDPTHAYPGEVVRNRPPNGASDFRYEGRDSATVDWPHPFEARTVTVAGGMLFSASTMRKLKSLVPPRLKQRLRKK